VRKQASFWREKRDTVVIFEVLQKCRLVKTRQEHGSNVGFNFFDQQKGSVTSNKNNWVTFVIPLTINEINRPGYKISTYFR